MKKTLVGLSVAAGLLAVASSSPAVAGQLIVADMPQMFAAGSTELPAGRYEFSELNIESGTFKVLNAETRKSVIVQSVTRLAMRSDGQPVIVLDKVGDKQYLSEIYPGDVDGYYFGGAPGQHTHVTVHAAKKK